MFRGDSDAEAQLKRRVASQDQAITNAGMEYANLAQELKEEKALKRELEHKVSLNAFRMFFITYNEFLRATEADNHCLLNQLNVEADKNVKSQAALHTKTEVSNHSKGQEMSKCCLLKIFF